MKPGRVRDVFDLIARVVSFASQREEREIEHVPNGIKLRRNSAQ